MRHQIAACVLFIGSVGGAAAAQQHETQLFELNAYEPVPSPDGKLIAYVLTGRKVEMFAGLGRSHLQSDVRFCDPSGQALQGSNIEGFLGEWLSNSSAVVGYRDWRFALLSPSGSRESDSMLRGRDMKTMLPRLPERVAYLSKLGKFVWLEYTDTSTVLQTTAGPMAEFEGMPVRTSAVIVPSPDERYLSMGETDAGHSLWVYDTKEKTLANLGSLTIHPDPGWDYFKPGWNPWFADGKHLAFFSGTSLYITSPNGKERRELLKADHGGLAIPSPDGTLVAYATFSPRPRNGRKDVDFWGGSSLWIAPSGGGVPRQVTNTSEDETYDLRWLTRESLIFDRIGEVIFNGHARIWTVPIGNR
ncbi:PD40 domain-containing protein [Alloacidobacterium dinghuense]|uniref:PD40 domain-containing protein n=1 Tax=Alloacidobacterium dinghuense TaxID=2763107 RepID=A0A7G8BN26_9BACT|nr:PD40 domain-containing protein [Alloacidobacterium dinghuense]QNI33946.1 PD40 domain-containing protein [Alloacidobacterium dinghuense]